MFEPFVHQLDLLGQIVPILLVHVPVFRVLSIRPNARSVRSTLLQLEYVRTYVRTTTHMHVCMCVCVQHTTYIHSTSRVRTLRRTGTYVHRTNTYVHSTYVLRTYVLKLELAAVPDQ